MSRPNFTSGVCAAAALAVLGSIAATALTPLLGLAAANRVLVPILGLGYLLYLLSRCGRRVGRVSTLALWSSMALALWILQPPIVVVLTAHIAALWLVRCAYFHTGVSSALLDLGLSLLAGATGYWAAVHSGSVLLALWCFFLVQALFVAIPALASGPARPAGAEADHFEQARRRAESAVRRLLAAHD